jgi:hypothetical protein
MKGIQGCEARLGVRDGQRLSETLVDVSQNRFTRAKVGSDGEKTIRVLRQHQISSLDISGDVRAAKAVNGLLGITDQKERARPDAPARPVSVRCPWSRVTTQPPKDLGLSRIRVLEFIHEHMLVSSREGLSHRLVISQQIARCEDQIVEVQERGGSLVLMEAINRRLKYIEQTSQQLSCNIL